MLFLFHSYVMYVLLIYRFDISDDKAQNIYVV